MNSPHLQELRAERWLTIVPRRFRAATLETLPAPISDTINMWALREPSTLMFAGGIGTGKTWAAWATLRHLYVDRGEPFQAWTATEYVDQFLTDHRPALAGNDVVFVDDLGAERDTDWAHERIQQLIDEVWRDEHRFVVTTNLTRDMLTTKLGDRAASRMFDNAATVVLGGKDRRG